MAKTTRKPRLPATERVIYTPERIREAGWTIPSPNGDYFWFKNLTQAGTQEELARDPNARSMPFYFDAIEAAYSLRNAGDAIESFRQYAQRAVRTKFPSTLTRFAYMPEGQKDILIQDYLRDNQKKTPANLVGLDGEIQVVFDAKTCRLVTGKNPEQVKEFIDWLNQTNHTGIWRFNKKPEQREERVARLGAYSNWAYLSCVRLLDDRYSAFRVSREKN